MSSSEKNSSKVIIGLTGGIGTGKSTAARYLVSKGLVHIDADAISRQLTEKVPGVENQVLEEIEQEFGPSVMQEDGALDRQAMAKIVFSDPEKKKELESILFQHIIAEIHRRIEEAISDPGPVRVLLDVPLLFEAGLDSVCDYVIVLTADHDTRLRRVMERDGCAAEDVESRMRNQMPDDEKTARADFVADNSSSRDYLKEQLDEIICSIDKNVVSA